MVITTVYLSRQELLIMRADGDFLTLMTESDGSSAL
jgi:hypothetical protein